MKLKTFLLIFTFTVCAFRATAESNSHTVHGYSELEKSVKLCRHKNCTIYINKEQLRFPSQITLQSGNIAIVGKRQASGKYPMLNGQDKTRLFTIYKGAAASFDRLVLKKGKADSGGALNILGNVEYIRNCTFEGNQAGIVSALDCSLHHQSVY